MQRPASAEVLAELIDEAEPAGGRRGGSGAAEMAARHVGACCRARADETRAKAARAVVEQVLQGGRDSAVRPVEGHIAVESRPPCRTCSTTARAALARV